MKITISDESSIVYWRFLTVVSDQTKREEWAKVLASLTKGTLEFDIVLTINGEEFNFEHIIKRYEEILDEEVERRALEIVKEKFDDLSNKLHDIGIILDDTKDNLKRELQS